MEMPIWNTLIVVSKAIFYINFSALIGILFLDRVFPRSPLDMQPSLKQVPMISIGYVNAFIALLAVLLWFFANTGAMAENGVAGMIDPVMLDIMWDSSIGNTVMIRLFFLLIILFMLFLLAHRKLNDTARLIIKVIYGIGLLTIAYSFSITGHVSEFGHFETALIVFHVGIMGWWFGFLLPLRFACSTLDYAQLFIVMKLFGDQAAYLVPLLLMAGLLLAYTLVGSITGIINTDYGQVLLLKVLVVTTLLAIAAYHKFRLVPRLANNEGREQLAKSINIEMMVAFSVLLITSGLTSLIGPEEF